MISKVGQVMLYVKDQDRAVDFWTTKLGFIVVSDESGHGMRWIEIAPLGNSGSNIVLHNKEAVAKMSPELNLGTPSLMFFTEDAEKLHNDLSEKGIIAGDIVDMPTGKVFNFADSEENYFAVMEKPK
ncbi:VOC family protein [Planomicrobium sp. CPCC 101110]|uniref:VOC family protein n=1 Tax=Planomicrobium sp. CPCC 101110 TaxID=2599619 RepID=UPI0011B71456|nr:VOC family protein [Planomicrobium sp. CPCC 101110]TWT27537.1 VOC family protein [Planomicrobium sp. CPCC 101110]